jgi:hypothetical protein
MVKRIDDFPTDHQRYHDGPTGCRGSGDEFSHIPVIRWSGDETRPATCPIQVLKLKEYLKN